MASVIGASRIALHTASPKWTITAPACIRAAAMPSGRVGSTGLTQGPQAQARGAGLGLTVPPLAVEAQLHFFQCGVDQQRGQPAAGPNQRGRVRVSWAVWPSVSSSAPAEKLSAAPAVKVTMPVSFHCAARQPGWCSKARGAALNPTR